MNKGRYLYPLKLKLRTKIKLHQESLFSITAIRNSDFSSKFRF